MAKPYLSVVIPIYNEADNLEQLYSRLMKVLIDFGKSFEVILVNDGSRDHSTMILNDLFSYFFGFNDLKFCGSNI